MMPKPDGNTLFEPLPRQACNPIPSERSAFLRRPVWGVLVVVLLALTGLLALYYIDRREGGQVWWVPAQESPLNESWSAHRDAPARPSQDAAMSIERLPANEEELKPEKDWLPAHQEPDGHWDTRKHGADQGFSCDTAATALALMTMTGAGHTDRRGNYKTNVKAALEWIIDRQTPSGFIQCGDEELSNGIGPYVTHAICGLALSESYAMSKSPWLEDPARRAAAYSQYFLQNQRWGIWDGWRTEPGELPSLTATVWFVMQMKSAKLAGLLDSQDHHAGAIAFLDSLEMASAAGAPDFNGRFRESLDVAEATPLSTIRGCLARQWLGEDNANLENAATWAVGQLGTPQPNRSLFDAGPSNWSYSYFGTLLCFNVGGDLWTRWNNAMRPMLVKAQCRNGDEKGSWDPQGSDASYGRVWSTAHATLILEVYYQYMPSYYPCRSGGRGTPILKK